MADIQINAEKFYQRLGRLIEHWAINKSTLWGGADAICIMLGTREDETSYSKASALHLYLLGYEITDSIIIVTKNSFWFMASDKKCKYLETSLANKSSAITFHPLHKTKDEGMNREHFNTLLGVARKGGGSKLGSLFQVDLKGSFIQAWMNSVDQSQLEKVEISQSVGLLLCVKDESEIVSSLFSRFNLFFLIFKFSPLFRIFVVVLLFSQTKY
jgi:nucleosome binding factor SPN SPT16 subunit